MVSFCFLNKGEKALWLPAMFDLLYENMNAIAPSGMTYEEEKVLWLENVSPALEKAPRQVVLCLDGDALVGFLQYYTREELLMVEEVQLKRAYQKTLLFCGLCRHMLDILPAELQRIEAYADRRNDPSIRLMKKAGMVPLEVDDSSHFVHMGGSLTLVRALVDRGKSARAVRAFRETTL